MYDLTWLQPVLDWLTPSAIGAVVGWLTSSAIRRAHKDKQQHNVYKKMYDDLALTVEELGEKTNKIQIAYAELNQEVAFLRSAMGLAGNCRYFRTCPVLQFVQEHGKERKPIEDLFPRHGPRQRQHHQSPSGDGDDAELDDSTTDEGGDADPY